MSWVLLSVIASIFFALRYVIIKKYLSDVDTLLLAFSTRIFGVLYLLPFLFVFEVNNVSSILFWKTIIITSVLTAAASIMQLNAIKKYELSSSVPFLSFIPLFMIFTVYIIFDEFPNKNAFIGIIFLSIGGIIINQDKPGSNKNLKSFLLKNFGSVLFFGVAIIFGITTTLDRLAINDANCGGFTYTFFWHLFSALLFSFIFLNFKKSRTYIKEFKQNITGFVLQGLFGITAFLCQMMAVEFARKIEANVLYIKAITLLQLFISVLFGLFLFKEKNAIIKIIGSIIMLSGALIVILYSK